MTEYIPLVLAVTLGVVLIVGGFVYWRFLNTPWDEWDEISHDADNEDGND